MSPKPKILFIFGTRPEAIKLCPVVLYMKRHLTDFDTRVCVTAQHRGLLDQVLAAFSVTPDYDLDVMLPGQTLFQSTSRILAALEPVLLAEQPAMIFVQGDTTTTFCGALAGFYRGVPVAHVEAGLRTWDMRQPFPEEMNRVLTTRLTALHLPPTEGSAANLRRDGVPDARIAVTGNTCIDALLAIKDKIERGEVDVPRWEFPHPAKRMILVTGHRRESFGGGFERICEALRRLAEREDVELVYPVHPNPNVREPVERLLGGRGNVHLIDPQDYVPFVDLMRRSYLILTDSGGVQEEAPSLGKPVLVMREKTERPEAVEAGTSRLVGTDAERIAAEAALLLDDAAEYDRRSHIHNPYGDGLASERIVAAVRGYFGPVSERGSIQCQ
ncbi:MAG: UDP-N-acetylglucosamine 2-epimerase (non-hydrolyzing) [Bryobacterales bacterium]|nr:UDP-N-acetylglucosamine 2-epimerase (non-hydrolyzing) [Bryobacterales bacterium]